MADKTEKLIIDALRLATTERAGVPLLANRKEPGLFPASASGQSAAERACSLGLIAQTGSNSSLWSATEAGLNWLLKQSSPRQVLEDCVRAIEARQEQLEKIRATVSRTHANLDGLRATIERALAPVTPASAVRQSVSELLTRWDGASGQDCPLPDLFRQLQEINSGLSIGEFHDALRALRAEQRLELHPWTGPLYAMPEPVYALLCGHEVVYYARARATAPSTEPYLAEAG
ncbi:MAG: hypothetical protein ACJ8C4_19105 [Gemmataceae bacterium]